MNWIKTYALVPARVRKGNLLAIWLQRLSLLFALGRDGLLGCSGLVGHSDGHGFCGWLGLDFGLGVEAANLQLALVLLQDALVVVLPELLGCILAGYTLEDLLAT